MICLLMLTKESFGEWLQKELDKRNWNQAELARRSGLTTAGISLMSNGQRGIGPDACNAIARAFGMPPETVFAAAGLLPPKSPESEKKSLLEHMFDMLPEDEQDDILDFVRFKQEQWRREQAGQSGKPKPVTGELK